MSDETQKPETTPQGGKLFDQQEVDRIVEQRLARERARVESQLAEAESAKAKVNELNEKLKTLDTLSTTAAEKDKLIDEVHAGLLNEIPEDMRGLVPAELPKDAQIRYIQKNKARLFATATAESGIKKPDLPPDGVNKTTSNGALPGGYKSVLEFSQRDPKGFLAWDKAHK